MYQGWGSSRANEGAPRGPKAEAPPGSKRGAARVPEGDAPPEPTLLIALSLPKLP